MECRLSLRERAFFHRRLSLHERRPLTPSLVAVLRVAIIVLDRHAAKVNRVGELVLQDLRLPGRLACRLDKTTRVDSADVVGFSQGRLKAFQGLVLLPRSGQPSRADLQLLK